MTNGGYVGGGCVGGRDFVWDGPPPTKKTKK